MWRPRKRHGPGRQHPAGEGLTKDPSAVKLFRAPYLFISSYYFRKYQPFLAFRMTLELACEPSNLDKQFAGHPSESVLSKLLHSF